MSDATTPAIQPNLPTSLSSRLGFMLLRASTAAGRLATTKLQPLGIEPRHHAVLALVVELGPLSQQDLADLLHVDRSTMVSLIDDLETRRYVRRRRSHTDRRAYAIHPTPAGRTAQTRAATLLLQCEREYLAELTTDEQDQLYQLLARLITTNPAN
jgi:DNA-binding MarR family transcriptional regulator